MGKELLKNIKMYIEQTEIKIDEEWGLCRNLKELIRDEEMPKLYFDVCELINKYE